MRRAYGIGTMVMLAAMGCEENGEPRDDARIGVIEARLDATASHDWDTWEALHTPDCVRTAPELETPLVGAPSMRLAIETLSAAFPDYRLELIDAHGTGDWWTFRFHTTGTMTGPLTLGDGTVVPPTGMPISQEWVAVVRFEGDLIAEFHEYYDQYTLLMQLGLL